MHSIFFISGTFPSRPPNLNPTPDRPAEPGTKHEFVLSPVQCDYIDFYLECKFNHT